MTIDWHALSLGIYELMHNTLNGGREARPRRRTSHLTLVPAVSSYLALPSDCYHGAIVACCQSLEPIGVAGGAVETYSGCCAAGVPLCGIQPRSGAPNHLLHHLLPRTGRPAPCWERRPLRPLDKLSKAARGTDRCLRGTIDWCECGHAPNRVCGCAKKPEGRPEYDFPAHHPALMPVAALMPPPPEPRVTCGVANRSRLLGLCHRYAVDALGASGRRLGRVWEPVCELVVGHGRGLKSEVFVSTGTCFVTS